ncbi:hypothetical protein QWZ13_14110 [Reinekea marina]|uniref:hypothetical protein n=1 Tax=Reinekea marina TaxID=1310421 RepID=UPI0025B5A9CD|nr:hypothetical protein [Reinekea marina]MDN3650050.1 hypothetical protein [Reinekea marina]
MKKIIHYVIPFIGTIGYLGYISIFGPLYGNEGFEWLRVFFVFGLLFYITTVGYTFPYILVGLITLYFAHVYKGKGDAYWLHLFIAGIWNVILALVYVATIYSGSVIMV